MRAGGVAGLPVLERTLCTLARAGIRRALVVGAAVPGGRDWARMGLAVDQAADLGAAGAWAPGPVLLARADRVYDPALLKAARAVDLAGGAGWATAGACGLYALARGEDAVRAAAAAPRTLETPAGSWFPVATDRERAAAERALFRALRKSGDGPVSRYINRVLSLSVSRLIVDTRITPNQITLVANAIGALGVWFVLRSTWTGVAVGAALVNLQSILDGCDGEIARLKFQSSRFGEWLDNVLDDLVNSAFGLSLGLAVTARGGGPAYRWLGIGAAAAFMIYNLVVYAQLAFVHHTGNPFAFRWWFQRRDQPDLHAALARGGALARLGGAVRSLARRDTFLFGFMLLCAVRLAKVAVVWYAIIAAGHLVMTLIHICAGGRVFSAAPAARQP